MVVADSAQDFHRFGVGARIGETLLIFGSHFAAFATAAIMVGIIGELPMYLLIGKPLLDLTFGAPQSAALTAVLVSNPMLVVAVSLVPILIDAILSGIFILAAEDARLARPVRIPSYAVPTFRKIVPLFLISVLLAIAVMIGLVAAVVPGLWIMGVFAVAMPAIMIEDADFRSLQRSYSLTKGYRWPIIGLSIISYVFTQMLGLVVALVNMTVPTAVAVGLSGALDGMTTALISISMTVVFARMREIKEGSGFAAISDVFL